MKEKEHLGKLKLKRKMQMAEIEPRTRTRSLITGFVLLHLLKFMNAKHVFHTFMSCLYRETERAIKFVTLFDKQSLIYLLLWRRAMIKLEKFHGTAVSVTVTIQINIKNYNVKKLARTSAIGQ